MSKYRNVEFTAPPPEEMETVDCNLCHWQEYRKKFVRFGYKIVECPNCSLRWVNPRIPPSAVEEVYAERYFKTRDTREKTEDLAVESFKKDNSAAHLREIEKHHRKGKILDLGCAEGLFLRIAREHRWDVAGVELSPQAAEIAGGYLPGKIKQGLLGDANFPDESFDVVTMFDVVEHLYDPVTELKEINRLLKPGGIVYLLTPDCKSLYARIMGRYWFEIKPREHIYYFSRKTIKHLFELTGFQSKEIKSAGKVLTFKYIAKILEKENPVFGLAIRLLTKWTPWYNKPLTYSTGFVAGIGLKPERGTEG